MTAGEFNSYASSRSGGLDEKDIEYLGSQGLMPTPGPFFADQQAGLHAILNDPHYRKFPALRLKCVEDYFAKMVVTNQGCLIQNADDAHHCHPK